MSGITSFVKESNRIEGIIRAPSKQEVDAHRRFLSLAEPTVDDLVAVVAVIAPGHVLRDREGLDVRVGNHIAPRGCADIRKQAEHILTDVIAVHPYKIHQRYEHLHPFTDGNGRSGRLIWLWGMKQFGGLDRALHLGFLHLWYYQSLEAGN